LLIACAGVAALYLGWRETATVCLMTGLYGMPLFGCLLFFEPKFNGNYIPFRWIIVRDGIWLRSSKDVSRFLWWRSLVQVDAESSARSKWCQITLVTDAGDRETFKSMDHWELLAFVNKLLAILPHGIDAEPLEALQQRLRFKTLYAALYELRDAFLALGFFATAPVFALLNHCFPANDVGFGVWGAIMGVTLLTGFGIYIRIRRAVVRRNEQQVEGLLWELDETDVTELLRTANSPRHVFGLPPRTVTPNARRHLLFSGETGHLTLTMSLVFTFATLMFAGILWFDETVDVREMIPLLGFGLFFDLILVLFVGACFFERKRVVRLLETAVVVKYRKHKRIRNVKTILKPVGGTAESEQIRPATLGEELEVQSQSPVMILPGETVHVFLNESKPKKSLIAEESLRCELRFDPETGEIDCTPSPLTRFAKWSLAALALGIGLIVLRVAILLW